MGPFIWFDSLYIPRGHKFRISNYGVFQSPRSVCFILANSVDCDEMPLLWHFITVFHCCHQQVSSIERVNLSTMCKVNNHTIFTKIIRTYWTTITIPLYIFVKIAELVPSEQNTPFGPFFVLHDSRKRKFNFNLNL